MCEDLNHLLLLHVQSYISILRCANAYNHKTMAAFTQEFELRLSDAPNSESPSRLPDTDSGSRKSANLSWCFSIDYMPLFVIAVYRATLKNHHV